MLLQNAKGDCDENASRHEHWKLEEKAYRQAYTKMLCDAFLMDMETEPDKYFTKDNSSSELSYNLVRTLIAERGRKWGGIKICFTVKGEYDNTIYADDLLNKIEKISRWKWVKSMAWNIEWRDHKKTAGMHFHALILMDKDKKYSQGKKQLINSWSKYGYAKIFPTNRKNIDYIKGKKEKKKMKMVENDRILRRMIGLEDIYYSRDTKENSFD